MSVAGDIAAAISTAITALNIPDCTIAIRKRPSLPPGKELAAGESAVVISVSEEQSALKTCADKALITRTVHVAYIETGGEKLGESSTLRDRSESIRRVLSDYATYASVAMFNDVNISRVSPYEQAAMNATALNYAMHAASVETHEERT